MALAITDSETKPSTRAWFPSAISAGLCNQVAAARHEGPVSSVGRVWQCRMVWMRTFLARGSGSPRGRISRRAGGGAGLLLRWVLTIPGFDGTAGDV
jgi:hypothetical protein